MFKTIKRRCRLPMAHDSHWEWEGFFNHVHCMGRAYIKTEWERANPSIGERVSDEALRHLYNLPDPHRHCYHIARTLVTPKGFPVDPSCIYWQCCDSDCWTIRCTPRDVVHEEMLRKPVYQTWPG